MKVILLCFLISCASAQEFGAFKVIDTFNKLTNLSYDIPIETKLQFKVVCDTFNHHICKDKVFMPYKKMTYAEFKALSNNCYTKNIQLFLAFEKLAKLINHSIKMHDLVFMRYHVIVFLKHACDNPLIRNNRLASLYDVVNPKKINVNLEDVEFIE